MPMSGSDLFFGLAIRLRVRGYPLVVQVRVTLRRMCRRAIYQRRPSG